MYTNFEPKHDKKRFLPFPFVYYLFENTHTKPNKIKQPLPLLIEVVVEALDAGHSIRTNAMDIYFLYNRYQSFLSSLF